MMNYGNMSIYDRTVRTHRTHNQRFGYPFFLLETTVLEGVWNKYAILLSVLLQELQKPLNKRLEWLFWFDADTVILNPNIPLEIFLPPSRHDDVHLLLTKDWNGMNNGVFPLRVNSWSVELLSAALAYPVTRPDVALFWPDQSALDRVLHENQYFAASVAYCPLRWFNAYMASADGKSLNPDSPEQLQVHRGDLLVHFPGTPRSALQSTLQPYLVLANEHFGEWELRLEDTQYLKETRDFWASRISDVATQADVKTENEY
ncbi:hypothetical protein BB8028_0007g00180 [Beauveria bassiana]|uniref:Galactosyl transferase GMA12/MNN10 family protein n=1 Tax=Beauveria bassiana TaxID=176275 RepID=A0A2S7YLF6_BEABA|nr:hypothetical protein BB8028_0007g00180 [Beauveria bassiana]